MEKGTSSPAARRPRKSTNEISICAVGLKGVSEQGPQGRFRMCANRRNNRRTSVTDVASMPIGIRSCGIHKGVISKVGAVACSDLELIVRRVACQRIARVKASATRLTAISTASWILGGSRLFAAPLFRNLTRAPERLPRSRGRGFLPGEFTRNRWAGPDRVGERTCARFAAVTRAPMTGLAECRLRQTRRLLTSQARWLACRRSARR